MRFAPTMAATLFGAVLIAAPASFADEKSRDNILRVEAQIKTLNPVDAGASAAIEYQAAQLRLSEAKAAEDRNRGEESLWRSEEASVQANIVQEKIKLRGLERTVSEIEAGLSTLRRETNS
jgi:uncharacterized protein YlxW (UPF0749 family)